MAFAGSEKRIGRVLVLFKESLVVMVIKSCAVGHDLGGTNGVMSARSAVRVPWIVVEVGEGRTLVNMAVDMLSTGESSSLVAVYEVVTKIKVFEKRGSFISGARYVTPYSPKILP